MKYFEYPFIDEKIMAITTNRECGNMAFQVGDNYDEVKNNRHALFEELNIDENHVVFVHQSHSDIIEEVTLDNDGGKGKDNFESGVEADALYTKEKRLALGIFHADCVPVFFYDLSIPLVGIIHSGFKGTLKHIVFKALGKVIQKEHLDTNNLHIVIGPYRHQESFELNQESFEQCIINYLPVTPDRHINLSEAIKFDLGCLNVPPNNIKDINVDTCQSEKCYSAIKKTPVGRMSSLIYIK